MLAVGMFVGYLDRVNLSVAAGPLSQSLHLSPSQLGVILSAYLWTYAVLQLPVGSLIDRIGIRWIMRISTILWTLASFLTAFAGGLGTLMLYRLILGIGETPVFPASWKATTVWFPYTERSTSTGLLNAASRLSSFLGLPAMAFVVSLYGWQAAFILTGFLSLLYTVAFWAIYRSPADAMRAGRLTEEEHAYIVDGGAHVELPASGAKRISLRYLLRRRKVWGLTLGYGFVAYVTYLLLSWLPVYLQESLGVSVLSSGLYSAIPWGVAALAEFFIAGRLADYLVKRAADPTRTRRGFLVFSGLATSAVIGAIVSHSVPVVVVFLSVGMAGLVVNITTGVSIIGLVAPSGSEGTLGGLVNAAANLIGLASPIVTGFVVQTTGSFIPAFIIAGVFMALGLFCYLVVLGRIEQIPRPASETDQSPGDTPVRATAH